MRRSIFKKQKNVGFTVKIFIEYYPYIFVDKLGVYLHLLCEELLTNAQRYARTPEVCVCVWEGGWFSVLLSQYTLFLRTPFAL